MNFLACMPRQLQLSFIRNHDRSTRETTNLPSACSSTSTPPVSTNSSPSVPLPVIALSDDRATEPTSSAPLNNYTDPISRPRLPVFPKDALNRSFNASWYDMYEWLEYIPDKKVSLCYPCRIYINISVITKREDFHHQGIQQLENSYC